MPSRTSIKHLVLLIVVTGLVATACTGPSSRSAVRAGDRPSIVLIVTDDQRWDTTWAMPKMLRRVAGNGVTFRDAFVVNPTCCPSRASILTGRYSHSTGVYTNSSRHGGFANFRDASTIATWLDSAGYRTAHVGKYLNGYTNEFVDYVPPGWDEWFAFTGPSGQGRYYNYELSRDGQYVSYGSAPDDYSTDRLASEAVRFIADTQGPLFLYFTPWAPHGIAHGPPRHDGDFADLDLPRPPSYDEEDVSDKPRWVRALPRPGWRPTRRNYFETLKAVDDAIAAILDALAETGRLRNTLVIVTSDNGFSWGEHRWVFKIAPYEESIRIPLVVRFDPVTTNSREDSHLALNIDIAPTIADVAGVDAPNVEGRSLMPLLRSSTAGWRTSFLIEHLNDHENSKRDVIPSYCAVRTPRFTYVLYATAEEELYDLHRDPHQLTNLVESPAHGATLERLRGRVRRLCDPPPPGFDFPEGFGS